MTWRILLILKSSVSDSEQAMDVGAHRKEAGRVTVDDREELACGSL